MSLAIVEGKVKAVLLSDGKWYEVHYNKQRKFYEFWLDSYEFVDSEDSSRRITLGGGREAAAGIPATGFGFRVSTDTTTARPSRETIKGPISSIVAIREA